MISKYAFDLFTKLAAVHPDIMAGLKSNKAFRNAWAQANAAGGSEDTLHALYRKHVNPNWAGPHVDKAQQAAQDARTQAYKDHIKNGPKPGGSAGSYGKGPNTWDDVFEKAFRKAEARKSPLSTGTKWGMLAALAAPAVAFAAYDHFTAPNHDARINAMADARMKKAASLEKEAVLDAVIRQVPSTMIASGIGTALHAAFEPRKDTEAIREYHNLGDDDVVPLMSWGRRFAGSVTGSALGAGIADFIGRRRGLGARTLGGSRNRGALVGSIAGSFFAPDPFAFGTGAEINAEVKARIAQKLKAQRAETALAQEMKVDTGGA